MANFSGAHDIFYPTPASTALMPVSSATGVSTAVFGTQTRAIQVVVAGTAVNSSSLVYMRLGTLTEAPQATSTTDVAIPLNWVQTFKVYPGQQASFITGDATTSYRAYVTQLTD